MKRRRFDPFGLDEGERPAPKKLNFWENLVLHSQYIMIIALVLGAVVLKVKYGG